MTLTLFWTAVLCLVAGLMIVYLSGSAKFPLLVTIVFWLGIAIVAVGALLLLAPVIVWLANQLKEMLGIT